MTKATYPTQLARAIVPTVNQTMYAMVRGQYGILTINMVDVSRLVWATDDKKGQKEEMDWIYHRGGVDKWDD